MKSYIFGSSALGMAIPAFEFEGSDKSKKVLILGGVHGNESEGVVCAMGLLQEFSKSYSFPFHLTVIPQFNMDGVVAKSRLNGNGVDLNRNLPTKDWNPKTFNPKYPPGPHANSEPENQALVKFLSSYKPDLIISLHSWNPLLNTNGNCHEVARAIQARTGYEIKDEFAYPTPGCLGTYAGLENSMPTLTYEIQRDLAHKEVLSLHVPAVLDGLKVFGN